MGGPVFPYLTEFQGRTILSSVGSAMAGLSIPLDNASTPTAESANHQTSVHYSRRVGHPTKATGLNDTCLPGTMYTYIIVT
jgi:hypothetical protein